MQIPEFYTWNEGGVYTLAEHLGKQIRDIRLGGQKVKDITLSSKGTILLQTQFEIIEYDSVIITSPPLESVFPYRFLGQGNESILDK